MSETFIWQALVAMFWGVFGRAYPHSDELNSKSQELVHLRRCFEKLATEHPEDSGALDQIYQSERRKIIEREPPEKNRDTVGASVGTVPTPKRFKVPTI